MKEQQHRGGHGIGHRQGYVKGYREQKIMNVEEF